MFDKCQPTAPQSWLLHLWYYATADPRQRVASALVKVILANRSTSIHCNCWWNRILSALRAVGCCQEKLWGKLSKLFTLQVKQYPHKAPALGGKNNIGKHSGLNQNSETTAEQKETTNKHQNRTQNFLLILGPIHPQPIRL